MIKKIVLWGLCCCWMLHTQAQLRFEVKIPPSTNPEGLKVFMACSFNNWSPGDPLFEMKAAANGRYFLELPDTLQHFEYKYTQGYWTMVEGTSKGDSRQNRIFEQSKEPRLSTVLDTIQGWEAKPTYRLYIKSIPANTPKDARIYIAGNFNNWETNNEHYRLQRQFDGTYRVSITTDLSKLEFKFTRGDWSSVEGLASGKARQNRVIFRESFFNLEEIPIDIASWEDLSGTFNFFSLYDLLLLFSSFQCILLVIAIPTMQDYNRKANRWLSFTILFTSVILLIKVLTGYRIITEQLSKILLVPDLVFLLYAPLFYYYLQKLLFKKPTLNAPLWWHFVLPSLQLLVMLPYFLMDAKELQLTILNRPTNFHYVFVGIGVVAWWVNVFYWYQCWLSVKTYQQQYLTQASIEQRTEYLMTVLVIQAICLVLWLFTGIVMFVGKMFDYDTLTIADKSVDIIWLAFSTIPYFLGYFAIHQPEIFRISQEAPSSNAVLPNPEPVTTDEVVMPENLALPPDHTPEPLPIQEAIDTEKEAAQEQLLLSWKEKIDLFMDEQKPYTNAGLTLTELAGMLKISPHLLSKVINEVYQKNFFDFINSYRIEAFKERFEDPRNRQYTMLAIAFEVGFNSKTAFNRAFKKMTQQTPREYFFDSRAEE